MVGVARFCQEHHGGRRGRMGGGWREHRLAAKWISVIHVGKTFSAVTTIS